MQVCNIARLLAAATPDFLPSLAIGAFVGLRSAEIERLEWKDIDLVARHSLGGALVEPWWSLGVALGWLWGAYAVPINRPWGGLGVALGGRKPLTKSRDRA